MDFFFGTYIDTKIHRYIHTYIFSYTYIFKLSLFWSTCGKKLETHFSYAYIHKYALIHPSIYRSTLMHVHLHTPNTHFIRTHFVHPPLYLERRAQTGRYQHWCTTPTDRYQASGSRARTQRSWCERFWIWTGASKPELVSVPAVQEAKLVATGVPDTEAHTAQGRANGQTGTRSQVCILLQSSLSVFLVFVIFVLSPPNLRWVLFLSSWLMLIQMSLLLINCYKKEVELILLLIDFEQGAGAEAVERISIYTRHSIKYEYVEHMYKVCVE